MRAVQAPVAFDGERFIDGGATVLVDGHTIVGVESYGSPVPEGVEVASYDDATLLPGLVDAHVHLVADGVPGSLEAAGSAEDQDVDATIARTLAQHAGSGTTTVRDLGDVRYRTLGFRDAVTPGVPRIVASGPPFTTTDGHCHFLGGVADGRASIEAAMAEHVERGVDVIKVMASGGMLTPGSDQLGVQFSAEDLALIVSLGHDAGLPVVAHAHSVRGAWHALAARVDGVEHFTCLSKDGIQWPTDLLEATADADIVVSPTIGWDPDRMAAMSAPPPAVRVMAEKFGLDFFALLDARREQMRHVLEHRIRVVSGIDAGVAPAKIHGIVWRAVVELTLSGYSVEEALASATSTPADAFGLGQVTGRLRPGLAADLLVVDGDVRADPTALGRPLAVLVRGERPSAS
jgi:imidazolonepropionase-like amidohydrolase